MIRLCQKKEYQVLNAKSVRKITETRLAYSFDRTIVKCEKRNGKNKEEINRIDPTKS